MSNVNEENSIKVGFLAKKSERSILTYKKSIDEYYKELQNAIKLKGTVPIFLDTNVLLRVYSISFKAREKLKKFFNDYKKRIFITYQVQKEYVKNREDIINQFYENVNEKIPQSFQKDVLNKIDSFINLNKVILKDYPKIEKDLLKLKNEADSLSENLNKEVGKDRESKQNIIFEDDVLEIISKVKHLSTILDAELKSLIEDYDSLISGIDKDKIDSEIDKPSKSFPGMADFKNKSEDPYGDFIIYHEMISYMQRNKTNAIFLTYDTSKGDWMQKNGLPHLHYIENIFLNTGQTLYILNAERIFEDLLDISFKSLIIDPETYNSINLDSEITMETLQDYLNYCDITKNRTNIAPLDQEDIDELHFNNYKTIGDIDSVLNRDKNAFRVWPTHQQLGQFGVLRISLIISDLNYVILESDGSIRSMDRYNTYRTMYRTKHKIAK